MSKITIINKPVNISNIRPIINIIRSNITIAIIRPHRSTAQR